MTYEIPLTPEQSSFAAENHSLIYKFLREKHLPADDFYDVIVFGYLRSVQRYFTQPELMQYSFGTIAWKGMEGELLNHNRIQRSKKHSATIISLHSNPYPNTLYAQDILMSSDELMLELETRLLLHDLAKQVSAQQMNAVHLKAKGYNESDIAKTQNTTIPKVKELLAEVHKILTDLCSEQ